MASLLALKTLSRSCLKSAFYRPNINAFNRRILHCSAAYPSQKSVNNILSVNSPLQVRNFRVSGGLQSSESVEHDHVMHWTAERILSVVLVGSIPAAFIISSPALEYLLALSLTVHSHWGVEAIVLDYIRPSVFGKLIPKLAVALVYGISALTFGGLCYFIYSDVGLVNAVRLLWKL